MKAAIITIALLAACQNSPITLTGRGPQPMQRRSITRAGWLAQETPSEASLRGLCAVDRDTCWASGSAGTFLLTTNAGRVWASGQVIGAEELDFRDVHAFDGMRALLLSAGSPARIYKTENGGISWRITHEDLREGVFFDAMDFWDELHGVAFSDPVEGAFLVIRTDDGGETWTEVEADRLPAPRADEAGFAASGTCLRTAAGGRAWIGTGGAAARVLYTSDMGATWSVSSTPILSGEPSCGVFSVAFLDGNYGVAVGGDYTAEEASAGNFAWTSDGGSVWRTAEGDPPRGFRSGVAYVPSALVPTLVCVGPSGSDISFDGGHHWRALGDEGYHTLSFSPLDGTGWAAGSGGRIARFVVLDD